MLDFISNSARVVATFKKDSFDGRPHLNFFYSAVTLRKTVQEIRLEYVHRGETYLTASIYIRVRNCAFLVANAIKNLVLATRIS